MKIKQLIMTNIGPFKGTHIIDLENDSELNGYAFFGANGRGKTSIYNAMKWCLWGEVKTRVRASRGSKISASLRPIVGSSNQDILMNREAYENEKIQSMGVIILAENQNGGIQISRSVESKTTLARTDDDLRHDLTVVFEDETTSDKSTGQELIEKFFPRELQQFFFIDGEALEEYTDMMERDSTMGLKDEIESVLRIPSMTRGLNNLESIRRKNKYSMSARKRLEEDLTANEKKLREKINQEKKHVDELEELKKRLQGRVDRISEIRDKIEEYKEFKILFDELETYKTYLDAGEIQLKRSSDTRLDSFRNKAWKVMIWKRVEKIYDDCGGDMDLVTNSEFQKQQLKNQIEKGEKEIKEMDDICSHCEQKIPNLEKYIQNRMNDIKIKKDTLERIMKDDLPSIDNLTVKMGRLTQMKPERNDENNIEKQEKYWKDDVAKVKNLKEKIKKIEEKITKEAVLNLGELGEKLGTQQQIMRGLDIKIQNKNMFLFETRNEIKKLRLRIGKPKTYTDVESKIDETIGKLIITINDTINEYRQKARTLVEKNATDVFMQVTNAKTTFMGIKLDKEFRAQIVLKNGKVATAPSSGMKSMMTISIIDSLRRVSMLNAPIFFDTPGRSLDNEHKKALLNYFWRDHGSQFFIFAHSGEYEINSTIDEFGNRISKAWELTWPGDHKICRECNSENIMPNRKENKADCLECKHTWDTSDENTIITELGKS